MKKILTLLLTFFIFYQLVLYFNNKADDVFFGQFYSQNYDVSDPNGTPTLWEKTKKFFDDLFTDKNKKRVIYK